MSMAKDKSLKTVKPGLRKIQARLYETTNLDHKAVGKLIDEVRKVTGLEQGPAVAYMLVALEKLGWHPPQPQDQPKD